MLNLFELNLNEKTENKKKTQEKSNKHFSPSTREWNNSIYTYNKNALKTVPQASISSLKLVKSYFNLYNFKLERAIRDERLLRRLRRLSTHRIFVSNAEFKHTNNKVVITLYLFNRQNINYKRLPLFYKKAMAFKSELNKLQLKKINALYVLEKDTKRKLILVKDFRFLSKVFSTYEDLHKFISNYYNNWQRILINSYIYYIQLWYINRSKFNYTYLQYLKKYLEKIYNKNVEFNLVNLKRFYLNSDILSESLSLKIRKNRRKLLKYLNTIKRKVKIHNKKHLYYQPVLNNLSRNVYKNGKFLKKVVFENIKYKHITGFRIEAKGRLTRRYTASRSISKFKYKGNLLNIDSSFRGLSSVILKGNLKSNLQYTKSKSKTRIGSFSVKSWVSGN